MDLATPVEIIRGPVSNLDRLATNGRLVNQKHSELAD